jgi:hypothetical protein
MIGGSCWHRAATFSAVIAGLDPAIHDEAQRIQP